MKKFLLTGGIVLGVLLLFVALEACGSNLKPRVQELEKQNQALKEIAGPPPDSLDNFFPPKAQAPVWLIEMFNLSGPFEGIGVDLQEQDMAGVKANYQAFKAQYTKMSTMVPEWTSRFPKGPVDALGKAIDSGNPAQIGPAMGQVGGVCDNCHKLYMTKVQQKYHWRNFDDIKVTDPVSNQSLSWRDYMMAMAGAYSGIATNLQERQLDNARKNFQAFSARFKALPENGCKQCHDTPRTYFVDPNMQAKVDQLGQALSASAPDPQTIGQLSGLIGNEACLKCHWVHFPAQNAKDLWEKVKEVTK